MRVHLCVCACVCALRDFMWLPCIYFKPSKIDLNTETMRLKRTKDLRGLNNTETRRFKRLGAELQRHAKYHTGRASGNLHVRTKQNRWPAMPIALKTTVITTTTMMMACKKPSVKANSMGAATVNVTAGGNADVSSEITVFTASNFSLRART